MGRKRKRLRLKLMDEKQCSTKEGEDFISALPDDILCSILSLLSIKNNVKTSILSTRWRYLWAYRPDLEFDLHNMVGSAILDKGLQDDEGVRLLNSAFVSRVGKFLQLYRGPKIYSMAVSYCSNQESFPHLDRWIGFSIAMGVESLKIILSCPPYMMRNNLRNYKVYSFPCLLPSLGKTSCLKHLQLQLCNLECPPNFNGFNTLVTVDLQDVRLNESSLETFFSSCVLLQVLTIRCCLLPANLEATGPCVNLKCLELLQCAGVYKILVSAPKLTSFTYCGSTVYILLYSVPRLKRLFINFDGGYGRATLVDPEDSVITRLPEDMPQLESLFLQLIVEMRVLPAKLASYVNLKELELEALSRASGDFLWIVSTIDALPLLLRLHVMLVPNSRVTRGKVRTFGSPHNQLKEVLITGFVPQFYQTELVINLLKNCVALKQMTVDPDYIVYDDLKLTHLIGGSVWEKENGEEEQFYELIQREVPERAGLLTIL